MIFLPDIKAFRGGIALTSEKSLSSEAAIEPLEVPSSLLYPLETSSGLHAIPLVKEGDTVKSGTPLAIFPDQAAPPICATSSGTVFFKTGPQASAKTPKVSMVGIETDGYDHEEPPLPPLASSERTVEAVLQRLHACGILGMGGAGFPTARKLQTLQGPLRFLIVNGAECEPYLTCDERIIRERTEELLDAALLIARIFKIPQILLAVESERQASISRLDDLITACQLPELKLIQLQNRYPAGGERQIILAASGIEIPHNQHPVDVGILCLNVQTVLAAARAIQYGERLISRIVTVSGPGIRTPRNLEARIGTPLKHLIEASGGCLPGRHHLVLGGPMMGFSVQDDEIPIVKTLSAILAFPDIAVTPNSDQPCIRCGQCVEVCPQGLFPQLLNDHARTQRLTALNELQLLACIECACCDHACPSQIPLTQNFKAAKRDLRRHLEDEQMAASARQRFEARQERLKREQSERESEVLERKSALDRERKPKIQEALARARLKKEQRTHQNEGHIDES